MTADNDRFASYRQFEGCFRGPYNQVQKVVTKYCGHTVTQNLGYVGISIVHLASAVRDAPCGPCHACQEPVGSCSICRRDHGPEVTHAAE